MYRYTLLLFFQLLFINVFAKSKIVHHVISAIAEVSVYVPNGYDSAKAYRSVYFNDGETIFEEGFGWSLDKKLDKLIDNNSIEPIIIIGIYSKGRRLSWYTPYNDDWIKQNWGYYTPQSIAYTQMISETVIPFIEKNYAVKKEAASRAIFGYSLGGLHATWAGLTNPGIFGFSAGLSPSYWVADNAIMNETVNKPAGNIFWFDIGTAEWQYYIPFYKKLQQAGYKAGINCFYYEVKDAGHTAEDWIKRIDYPLIAFAGNRKDCSVIKMEVVFECIPSLSIAGKIYRRINAVVQLANGVKYSLSNTANYTLLKGDIKLQDDGTITAATDSEAAVEVSYPGFKKGFSST